MSGDGAEISDLASPISIRRKTAEGRNENMREYWKRGKRLFAAALALVLAAGALAGCGAKPKTEEELLAEMKEFVTEDGSASIYLSKDWTVEDLGLSDMGVDFWLCAQNDRGTEAALLMQFPKRGAVQLTSNMAETKDFVESNYGFTPDGENTETPAVPGMTNVEAGTGKAKIDQVDVTAYVVYGETEYAYYALMYCWSARTKDQITAAKASCSKFVENVPEEEDAFTAEMTDTLRWFNATSAILTELNGWDYTRFAGLPANEESVGVAQSLLDGSWGVTDTASADETLTWILSEGHRVGFVDDMEYLESAGIGNVPEEERIAFVLQYYDVDEAGAKALADGYKYYQEFGPEAIDAWDYCRAMNLLGFYYLAGYYTEQEALDLSLELATQIQPLYASWDELIDSYLRGYEYWAEESSDERRAVYEDLKSRPDNPFAVDYNTVLEKTW